MFVPCSASSRQLPLLSHPPRTLSIADADDDEDDLEDKDGFDRLVSDTFPLAYSAAPLFLALF